MSVIATGKTCLLRFEQVIRPRSRGKVEPMVPTRITQLALFAALVLIMPLESSHCAFMRFGRHVATEANASHKCCASAGTASTDHTPSSRQSNAPCSPGCKCFHLPAGIPASAIGQIETPTSPTSPASPILPSTTFLSAPRVASVGRVAALDVGTPALPDDPGAHCLRAPPCSA